MLVLIKLTHENNLLLYFFAYIPTTRQVQPQVRILKYSSFNVHALFQSVKNARVLWGAEIRPVPLGSQDNDTLRGQVILE